ncbi:TadE family type IV pilus minor pilin [Streptomyces filamentosus]|uniref:TadE family type IV pilus minor pilin n=1 Tax=Streptomyces filamentosus TaxID=67294 RepID=UPI00381043ED
MRRSERARGPGSDRGSVTVEAAVVLPVLALFAMALLWALAASAAQIRCVDAARAGARAAARAESPDAVTAVARAAAPEGARVTVARQGELWRVTVEAAAPGPAGLGVTLRAGAAALAEDTVGAAGGVTDGTEAGIAGAIAVGTGAEDGAGDGVASRIADGSAAGIAGIAGDAGDTGAGVGSARSVGEGGGAS